MTTPAPRRPRNRQGEGTRLREELITAAGRVMAALGSGESLSLRAVAREAGVSAPSVYLHFASKDELVRAVVLAHFAALQTTLESAIERHESPADRLRAGCLAYCRFAIDNPGAYRVLFGNMFLIQTGGEPAELGMDAFGVLVDAVARARAGRRTATDPFRTAVGVWSGLHGIVTLRAAAPRFPWPPLAEQLEDLVVGLVGVRRSATQ